MCTTDAAAICRGCNDALLRNPVFFFFIRIPCLILLPFPLGMSKKTNSRALAAVLQMQCTLGWGEPLVTAFSHRLGYCWHLLGSYQAIVGYLLSLLTNSPQKLLICTMMKSLGGLNCEFFRFILCFPQNFAEISPVKDFAKYLRTNPRFIIDSRIQREKQSKQNHVFWGEAFVLIYFCYVRCCYFL